MKADQHKEHELILLLSAESRGHLLTGGEHGSNRNMFQSTTHRQVILFSLTFVDVVSPLDTIPNLLKHYPVVYITKTVTVITFNLLTTFFSLPICITKTFEAYVQGLSCDQLNQNQPPQKVVNQLYWSLPAVREELPVVWSLGEILMVSTYGQISTTPVDEKQQ